MCQCITHDTKMCFDFLYFNEKYKNTVYNSKEVVVVVFSYQIFNVCTHFKTIKMDLKVI